MTSADARAIYWKVMTDKYSDLFIKVEELITKYAGQGIAKCTYDGLDPESCVVLSSYLGRNGFDCLVSQDSRATSVSISW